METQLQEKLKICTGHDWREVPQSYVDFRLRNNKSRPQMCVFTPDDITRQRARLFIPEDAHSHELHRPDVFLEKYLNAKNEIIKSMPWVKFDLDDFNLLPSLEGYGRALNQIYHYKISLTGDIKLRKTSSKNNTTISINMLKSLSGNAKTIVCGFLVTLKANYDYTNQKFSFGESVLGEDGATSLILTPPDTLTGAVTPSSTVNSIFYNGWEIETQLGYEINITLLNDHDSVPPIPVVGEQHEIAKDLKLAGDIALGIIAVGLIIFFSPEIIAVASVMAATASGAFMIENLQRV